MSELIQQGRGSSDNDGGSKEETNGRDGKGLDKWGREGVIRELNEPGQTADLDKRNTSRRRCMRFRRCRAPTVNRGSDHTQYSNKYLQKRMIRTGNKSENSARK